MCTADGVSLVSGGIVAGAGEACRSTGQHPPPAANTVRAAQDPLLLSNQERYFDLSDMVVRPAVVVDTDGGDCDVLTDVMAEATRLYG